MLKTIVFAGALALLFAPLQGAAILSTGFENPPYTLGALAGQDGWLAFGTTAITVENTTVKTGTQAVKVAGSIDGTQSGAVHPDPSTGPLLDVNVDLMVTSSTNETVWQFATLGPLGVGFLGGVNIFGTSIVPITGSPAIIGTFTRNSWHNLDLIFNMTAQRYNISLDGALLASNVAFCGDNSVCAGAVLGTLGAPVFDTVGLAGTIGNDSGFMDNLLVQTVPEPSTIALLGTGLLFIVRRTRRKRSSSSQ